MLRPTNIRSASDRVRDHRRRAKPIYVPCRKVRTFPRGTRLHNEGRRAVVESPRTRRHANLNDRSGLGKAMFARFGAASGVGCGCFGAAETTIGEAVIGLTNLDFSSCRSGL